MQVAVLSCLLWASLGFADAFGVSFFLKKEDDNETIHPYSKHIVNPCYTCLHHYPHYDFSKCKEICKVTDEDVMKDCNQYEERDDMNFVLCMWVNVEKSQT